MAQIINLNRKAKNKLAQVVAERTLTVVAWGRNTSGEVGQGLGVVHDEPTILSQLEGAHVTSIATGRHHSAAVVQTREGGTAFSWGCGASGKLGHGDSRDQYQPCRIEALVGQADVRKVALGHEHTLILDAEGAVFSCGNNLQGQCGHGTPLQDIADQQRADWEVGYAQLHGGASQGQSAWGPSAAQGTQVWNTPQQEQRMAWAHNVRPHTLQAERASEVDTARRLWASEVRRSGRALNFDGALETDPLKRNVTPTRIGRGLDDLVSDKAEPSGVVNEVVASVTAGKYFSAVSTDSGKVFTFGGGFSGELGNDRSWETSATSVEGDILEALEQEGGVREVCAGGTFCLALTTSGTVLVWGSFPGSPETRKRGTSRVVRVQGVPKVTHVAAGYAHAVLSDGQRVWAMGRWLTPEGSLREGGSWGRPEPVLDLEGVSCLAAGPHSAAAVSTEGQLHLWGKLLSEADVRVLRLKHRARDFRPPQTGGALWEGLGSSAPRPVTSLGRVRMVSLGLQHALAVVD